MSETEATAAEPLLASLLESAADGEWVDPSELISPIRHLITERNRAREEALCLFEDGSQWEGIPYRCDRRRDHNDSGHHYAIWASECQWTPTTPPADVAGES